MSFADWKVWHFETNVVFGDDDDYGEAVWDAAVATEREQSAKIAKDHIPLKFIRTHRDQEDAAGAYETACEDIAAAIRSGGNP